MFLIFQYMCQQIIAVMELSLLFTSITMASKYKYMYIASPKYFQGPC